jgi:hypothetical protein
VLTPLARVSFQEKDATLLAKAVVQQMGQSHTGPLQPIGHGRCDRSEEAFRSYRALTGRELVEIAGDVDEVLARPLPWVIGPRAGF